MILGDLGTVSGGKVKTKRREKISKAGLMFNLGSLIRE